MLRSTADRRLAAFVGGAAAVFALLLVFAQDPARVEAMYVRGVGPWLAGIPNTLTRALPFSLAELVIACLVLGGLGWLGALGRRWWRGARPTWGGLARTAALLVGLGLAVADSFYLVWGLAYSRPIAEARWGWTEDPDISAAELETLARGLVDAVNDRYLQLHGVPDRFTPTPVPHDWVTVDAAIDRGFALLPEEYGLDPDFGRSRGPAKRLLFSPFASLLRIGGFYFPFTAEANVNHNPPPWGQPFTTAHEKAHQRFIASENEASFYGFLACIHSDDVFVQYSGYLFAQRQVLRALSRADPIAFSEQIQRRLPGVQRDVDASYAFWTGYAGPVADVSRAVNDAYLRANGVAGGIQSYGRSLQLIVRYARDRAEGWPPAHPSDGEEL